MTSAHSRKRMPFPVPWVCSTTGEPWVWLTAMGLTIGLAMVMYLIGLIVVNGLEAFWPARASQIEIREDSKARLDASRLLGGKIVKIQQKAIRGDGSRHQTEWQIMVGNKETYGFSFLYIDDTDIANVSYPADVMLLERLEYGEAIG